MSSEVFSLDRGATRALRILGRALAARSRGSTLVVEGPGAHVADAMRQWQPALEAVGPEATAGLCRAGRRFGTVHLAGVLDLLPETEGMLLLGMAWELIRDGGRLAVTVDNGDAGTGSSGARFGRRQLTRILRRFGKPGLVTDQPYRWLAMELVKPSQRAKPIPRSRRDRYRVTVRLCRGRVIELGCGEGHLAGMVAARGHEVVGVDISREKIRAARRTYPDIEFHDCDIARLALPDQSFDTAVLAEVLEHVDEGLGARFLSTAWRLVRPGGRLIVSVPNEDCIPHRNHLRVFDRRALAGMLRPLGRPRPVHDQPYKWLMAFVTKDGTG